MSDKRIPIYVTAHEYEVLKNVLSFYDKAFEIQVNGDDVNLEVKGNFKVDKNARFPQGITTNGDSVLGDEQITYEIEGSVVDGSLYVYSHGNSYSNVRGYFKNSSATPIAAGTILSNLPNKFLHDAILSVNTDIGFDHILGKIKGGSWAWLIMTANGSDVVSFNLNVDLPAGALIYFTSCVYVGDYEVV